MISRNHKEKKNILRKATERTYGGSSKIHNYPSPPYSCFFFSIGSWNGLYYTSTVKISLNTTENYTVHIIKAIIIQIMEYE